MPTHSHPSTRACPEPPAEVPGTLGSASDRAFDAHLLVCDLCLGRLLALVLDLVASSPTATTLASA